MQHIDFVVNAMKRYCDMNQLLEHWKTDLDIDKQLLLDTHGWSSYCWIVSKTSSDLFPIGLHRRYDEMIRVVAECRMSSGAHASWINPDRAKSDGSYVIVPTDQKTIAKRISESRPYHFTGGDLLQFKSAKDEVIARVRLGCRMSKKVEEGFVTIYGIETVKTGFPMGVVRHALHGELVERGGLWVKFQDVGWDEVLSDAKPQRIARYA